MKLIIGLGNIGARYAHTRHNLGFMVVDEIAKQYEVVWKNDTKLKSELALIESEDLILAKPQTMMNLSGEAVQRLVQKYRLQPPDVWVLYDDVDVPFGKLRLRPGASSGQQGVRSIIAAIGPNFIHGRLGISLNDRAIEPSEVYVLKSFTPAEATQLPSLLTAAAKTITKEIQAGPTEPVTFTLL